MSRFAFIILIMLCHQTAFSSSRAQFLGMQTMIRILPQDLAGNIDNDSIEIYQRMNVPVKDSPMGPGKAIVTADRFLNFICSKGNDGAQCTIIIRQSADSFLNPLEKTAVYTLSGARADELADLFFLNQGQFQFKSQDQKFLIDIRAGFFKIAYAENGL